MITLGYLGQLTQSIQELKDIGFQSYHIKELITTGTTFFGPINGKYELIKLTSALRMSGMKVTPIESQAMNDWHSIRVDLY